MISFGMAAVERTFSRAAEFCRIKIPLPCEYPEAKKCVRISAEQLPLLCHTVLEKRRRLPKVHEINFFFRDVEYTGYFRRDVHSLMYVERSVGKHCHICIGVLAFCSTGARAEKNNKRSVYEGHPFDAIMRSSSLQ